MSTGNLQDTEGILYSVPFYGEHGRVRGLISIIFRTNVLEAILLDVPFLIVTDKDQAEANRLGLSMPDRKINFMLRNKKHGITVVDRRNIGFIKALKEIELDRPEDMVSATLDSYGDSEWTLIATIDPKAYEKELAGEGVAFRVKLKALFVTVAILIVGAALALRQRCRDIRKYDQLAKMIVNDHVEVKKSERFAG